MDLAAKLALKLARFADFVKLASPFGHQTQVRVRKLALANLWLRPAPLGVGLVILTIPGLGALVWA